MKLIIFYFFWAAVTEAVRKINCSNKYSDEHKQIEAIMKMPKRWDKLIITENISTAWVEYLHIISM